MVVGASAGGVEALKQLTEHLPFDLHAAIFVVLHIATDSPSVLPMILEKNGKLPVSSAKDGESIQGGHIYVAPPDHHLLLVTEGIITLSQGPKENRHRPAIDPLFRSASRTYGNKVIGVVLSGMLDDGTAGLITIKRRNGVCIAQDPKEASFPSMPQSAIDNADVDHVVSLIDLPQLLVKLTSEDIEEEPMTKSSSGQERESEKAMSGDEPTEPGTTDGKLVAITCPDCGGNLWEKIEGKNAHFQCHVGHAYSGLSLLEGNSEAVEEALWMALRIIQERITICRELAAVPRPDGNSAATRYEEEVAHAQERADLLRSVLHKENLLFGKLSSTRAK